MNTRDPRFRPQALSLGAAGLLALAVLAGCSGGQAAEQAPPPPEVGVAEVPVRPVSQWDEYSGRIEAVETVELRPRVSGYIEKVNYREGQEVKKGDVLFVIDDRSYRAELARAEAALRRARAQAELARSEASAPAAWSRSRPSPPRPTSSAAPRPSRPVRSWRRRRPRWTPRAWTWNGHGCARRSTAAPAARWSPPATWSAPATRPAC